MLGFSTTKGALVRSMLFPKPMGFSFYRDSMRFIGVLAGMAGLGFCASAIQFVRLGVGNFLRISHTTHTQRNCRYHGTPSFYGLWI